MRRGVSHPPAPPDRTEVDFTRRRLTTTPCISQAVWLHTFRTTGITAYLEKGGTIVRAQAIAAHELPARHREAEQEAAEDPARRGAAGPGLRGTSGHRGGQGGAVISADETRRCWAGEAASGPQDFLAAGQEVLPGGWYRPVTVRESWDRHPLAAQDRDQRRDQKWSDDARGAGVRRARGYQDNRGLLRAEGGGRRGGSPAHPDLRRTIRAAPHHPDHCRSGIPARLTHARRGFDHGQPSDRRLRGPSPGQESPPPLTGMATLEQLCGRPHNCSIATHGPNQGRKPAKPTTR